MMTKFLGGMVVPPTAAPHRAGRPRARDERLNFGADAVVNHEAQDNPCSVENQVPELLALVETMLSETPNSVTSSKS